MNYVEELPHALNSFERFAKRIGDKQIALFLDYDGTLTPIVSNPAQAILPKSMQQKIQQAAAEFKIAILSGRDLEDVKTRVGLPELYYGGSHGFDISGPNDFRYEYAEISDIFSALDQAHEELEAKLEAFPGIIIERKRFAIAVHFRTAAKDAAEAAEQVVTKISQEQKPLKCTGGKKIFELRPQVDWDKGRALQKLCEVLDIDAEDYVPLYIGDDETDEDAFFAIQKWGIGILVGRSSTEKSYADFWVNQEEVEKFISVLIDNYHKR